MYKRPCGFRVAAIRRSASSPAFGCLPSSAPTRSANARSKGASLGFRVNSSAGTHLNSSLPIAIASDDAFRACSIAVAERSMPTTTRSGHRRSSSRAAAPGPHPISRMRMPGFAGSAATASAIRDEARVANAVQGGKLSSGASVAQDRVARDAPLSQWRWVRGLTFEVTRGLRWGARPGGRMINSTWSRAWCPAAGPRVDRGVRLHGTNRQT